MPDEESLIEDLREIEKEFRDNEEYRKANIIDLFIIQSTRCKIPKQKIKDKIESLKKDLKNNKCRYPYIIEKQIDILEELLEDK